MPLLNIGADPDEITESGIVIVYKNLAKSA